MRISVPYLRLESSPLGDTTRQNVDSVYNFSKKLSADRQIFEVDSARHGDFSSLPTVVYKSGNCKNDQRFQTVLKLTVGYLEDHLKNKNAFSQVVGQELNKTIDRGL